MKSLILLILFYFPKLVLSQDVDPQQLISLTEANFNKVHDYSADIEISIDINFLKMPNKTAKIYFRQPDNFKLISEGFALLPKEGINFTPSKFLKEEFSAIYAGTDSVDNHIVQKLKIIPLSDTSKFILSTFWIDPDELLIRKISTTTKKSGTSIIQLSYNEESEFPLPIKVVFTFDVSGVDLPPVIQSNSDTKKKRKSKKNLDGTVIINYSNFVINKGIADSVFSKEKEQ